MFRLNKALFLLAGIIFMSSFGMAAFSNYNSNWQSYQPTFDQLYAGDYDNYWPILKQMEDGQCNATTDFIIGIPPGGCSPSVVRSDLLSEQNVPVFCQLYAIKVNPLIQVSSIKSISFKGDYPEGVRSVVFHPARSAVKSYSTLVGTPTLENIGYVVIILSREKVESKQVDEVVGNLTATMRYDAEDAYGTGRGNYYLEPMSDEEWSQYYNENSFWKGRGYLRVLDIEDGQAKIQVLGGENKVFRTITLKEGETSSSSYLPGFYCKAGLKVKLTDITTSEDMAKLNVDGDDIWVRKGDRFLDGKCYVRDLDVISNNDGSVDIRCSGSGDLDKLILKGEVVRLFDTGRGVESEYDVGDKFMDEWYIVSYGKIWRSNESYVLLADKMPGSSSNLVKIRELSDSVEDLAKFKAEIGEMKRGGVFSEVDIIDKELGDIRFVAFGARLENRGDEDVYFSKSVNVVQKELVEYYGSEKMELGDTWAEGELWQEIILAGELGKFATQKKLMDLFLDEYPLSDLAPYVRDMRSKLDSTDYSQSYASVYVGNEFKSISVVDFKVSSEGGASVDLKVGPNSYNRYNVSNNISLGDHGYLRIEEILPERIKIYFKSNVKNAKGDSRTRSEWVNERERVSFDGVDFYVEEINANSVAHVELIPDVKHEKSEADFTFRIEVEDREIELSPEKAQKMADNLEEAIQKWQNIVDRLGEVVSGLKGACFATSAFLTVKSMVNGVSGEAAARSKVMVKWKRECTVNHPEMTATQCYNEFSKEIEEDVKNMEAVLASTNSRMEGVQQSSGVVGDTGGIVGGEGIIDMEKYQEALKKEVGSDTVPVEISKDNSVNVPISELHTTSQIRSVLTWQEARARGGGVEEVAKAEMDTALRNVALSYDANNKKDARAKEMSERLGGAIDAEDVTVIINKDTVYERWGGKKGVSFGVSGEYADKKAQIVNFEGVDYLVIFGLTGADGKMTIEDALVRDDRSWVKDKGALRTVRGANVVFLDVASSGDCSYSWPTGTARVSYYEQGDNKGFPAIVPFDLENGWYAWVKNSGGGFASDSVQGYTDSGDVKNFYVCNIGPNRLMESGTPDDLCFNYYDNNIDKTDSIPCSGIDSDKIYSEARQAIREAQSQYSGKGAVNILGESISRGEPAGISLGVECQDFMSPEDCKMLFNVCDPVICPPSRCNFGGKFPVSDVIQTGVIGSMVLCLPNAKEGVIFPVCLSGIQAGLDGYLSILKSEKECLEHSIETGELVGICDQITSIYKCEFFWRQMSPLMDYLIPGVIDYAINGNKVRGGGEYALVSDAWENTKASVDYFKDYYAQNAFRAFNIRSTQEIGSSVCKAFVGTSAPGSANFIEDLLDPESPSQFYAQFSERLFSEATSPSTSQYKVYYHIYAGKDQGVQYKVYLKDPPASSYYSSNQEIVVDTGYVAAGSSADKSKDFTAPSGYKELCVVINAQEECGFKQVTSDFGLDWVQKKYTEDQVEQQDITTEKECISGTPSAVSMANLNLQDGAEEFVNPDISLRGIVRVCASQNPDAGVLSTDEVLCSSNESCNYKYGFYCNNEGRCESESEPGLMQKKGGRWKDVGYCGDAALRCWLDTDSVKDDLGALEALSKEGLGTLGDASLQTLNERRGLIDSEILTLEGVRKILSSVRSDISGLSEKDLVTKVESGAIESFDSLPVTPKVQDLLEKLHKVIGDEDATGAGTNGDRAEALALEASIWRKLQGKAQLDRVPKKEEPRVAEEIFDGDYDEGDITLSSGDGDEIDEGTRCDSYCLQVKNTEFWKETLNKDECEALFGGSYFEDIGDGCCCYSKKEETLKTDCRDEVGKRIVEIAEDVKKRNGISDATIKADTGANCFEELALMVARQESNWTHCSNEFDAKNCFECGDGNLLGSGDGESIGVMQINWEVHKEKLTSEELADFDRSVEYALNDVLVWGYKTYKGGKEFKSTGEVFMGWRAALRSYNGWGKGGDDDYVDNVLSRMDETRERFGDVCSGVSFT